MNKKLQCVVGFTLLIPGVGYLMAATWEDAQAAISVAKWLVVSGVGVLLGPKFVGLFAKAQDREKEWHGKGSAIDSRSSKDGGRTG